MNPITKIILFIVAAIFLFNFVIYFFFRALFSLLFNTFQFLFGLVVDLFSGLTSMVGLGATSGKWLLAALIIMALMGVYKRFTR